MSDKLPLPPDFKNPFDGLSTDEKEALWKKLMEKSTRSLNFHEVDGILKPMGLNWTTWATEINEDPSNFKRRFKSYIDRMNTWLAPLKMKVVIQDIAPKSESGEEKRKEKD